MILIWSHRGEASGHCSLTPKHAELSVLLLGCLLTPYSGASAVSPPWLSSLRCFGLSNSSFVSVLTWSFSPLCSGDGFQIPLPLPHLTLFLHLPHIHFISFFLKTHTTWSVLLIPAVLSLACSLSSKTDGPKASSMLGQFPPHENKLLKSIRKF